MPVYQHGEPVGHLGCDAGSHELYCQCLGSPQYNIAAYLYIVRLHELLDQALLHSTYLLYYLVQTQLACERLKAQGSRLAARAHPDSGSMGHAGSRIIIDGEACDARQVKALLLGLKRHNEELQDENNSLKNQLHDTNRKLLEKTGENTSNKEEIDKLKSVLQQKVMGGKPDILATIQEEASTIKSQTRKKQGVSGESSTQATATNSLNYYEKDFNSKHLIKNALKSNDFLKNLDKSQVHEIINCMYEECVAAGNYIIRENEAGNHLYVSAEGTLAVEKNGEVLGHISTGIAFGELAVLYGCTRTASIRAIHDAKFWVLDRKVFQSIMVKTGLGRQKERIEFIKSVESLKNLGPQKLAKIADVIEVDFFNANEYIIREGQIGDTFYIISDGTVQVTQRIVGVNEPKEIRRLGKGEYFGEKALLSEDRRTANVIAMSPGVELLTLNRPAFRSLIGDIREFKEKDYGDLQRQAQCETDERVVIPGPGDGEARQILHESINIGVKKSQNGLVNVTDVHLQQVHRELILSTSIDAAYKDIQLSDLEIVSTLGIGGFGRVELVQLIKDNSQTFALKCLKKQHIVDTKQQTHIYSEKKIMMTCRSPYIVRLHKTFKDRKFVYMMMEVCLGGELWTILRDRGYFDDNTARFAVACVLKAFQYLHAMGIVYRDLKPENLLVTTEGYVKLVDLGFAKCLPAGQKTWTFCGTPEYVAPEIILNKGHDYAVDIWAIGILIFELTSGLPPFTAQDPMKTYNVILKGIDALEFPKRVSRNSQHLIKRLCRPNPVERLGYQRNGLLDIMKHKWFQGFDWDGLDNRNMVTPLATKVSGPRDTSHFDKYPQEMFLPCDELSGWDAEF